LYAFYLKFPLTIALVFPTITIVFSAELLQGEHCINATKNHTISTIIIPSFHILFLLGKMWNYKIPYSLILHCGYFYRPVNCNSIAIFTALHNASNIAPSIVATLGECAPCIVL